MSCAAAVENPCYSTERSMPAAATEAIALGLKLARIRCKPSDGSTTRGWYYNTLGRGPFTCAKTFPESMASGVKFPWAMKNAYRSGGVLGLHWVFTNDTSDKRCLKNWDYYAADGTTLIATVSGRATNVTRNGEQGELTWCALPVYRPGGVAPNQFAPCVCTCLSGANKGMLFTAPLDANSTLW